MSYQSRRLQVGPLAVVVETDEASILNDFELLFAGFGDAPAKDPILTVRIVRADLSSPAAEPMYRALFDGKPVGGQANQNQVALAVTRKLNRAVLDAEPEVCTCMLALFAMITRCCWLSEAPSLESQPW